MDPQTIFRTWWQRLADYHSIIQKNSAIIAYSGGKDSTILLRFYQFLYQKHKIPSPHIFHMIHSIRNNDSQQQKLHSFLKENYSFHLHIKKKIFLSWPKKYTRV